MERLTLALVLPWGCLCWALRDVRDGDTARYARMRWAGLRERLPGGRRG
jgi:hypothetical protein